MPNASSPIPERRFVQDRLPWVVGAGALVLYGVTLHHWVTPGSISQVARVNGWSWPPTLCQPVLFLVTLPVQWLPEAWGPLALNLFTVLCAAFTLTLLARTVALLPHDRTQQQRLLVGNEQGLLTLPNAWVPVVLACAALGLQLSFWEHSIAASGEMLDLLLIAYVIRCLLEYRLAEGDFWLGRASLVFGTAMANSWAVAGFLPLFVAALLYTKRFRFFSWRFLRRLERPTHELVAPRLRHDLLFVLRMALLGLTGFSLVITVPLVQSLLPSSPFGIGHALQSVVGLYKGSLAMAIRVFLKYHRDVGLLLAAGSFLPVLLLSIRWRAFGSQGGNARFDPAALILGLAHAFLLLICLALLFDLPFSPRVIGGKTGMALVFLPLYYLTAICVGYYSGFFLLLFGPGALEQVSRRRRRRRQLQRLVPRLLYVLAGMVVVALALKNFPAIQAFRAPHLKKYAQSVGSALAPGSTVLCEEALRGMLLRAGLTSKGTADRIAVVSTRALTHPTYRAWLKRTQPGAGAQLQAEAIWDVAGTNAPPEALRLMWLVSGMAQSNSVYCLQANPGFLLERFCLQPRGLAHALEVYPTNSISAPPLRPVELAKNQAFWQRTIAENIQPLLRLGNSPELPRPAWQQWVMRRAHLSTPPPAQARLLATWYSCALNTWGATLQRNDLWKEATPCFSMALDLNPANLPARVNLLCNSNHLAGRQLTILPDPPFREQFDKYRDSGQLLAENGPFDEPTYCNALGLGFVRLHLLRQAAQQLGRAADLAPGDLMPRLTLAELFTRCLMPDLTLRIAGDIRADPHFQPLGSTNTLVLALLEADAWYAKTNRAKAEAALETLLATQTENPLVWDTVAAKFAAYRSFSNALAIVQKQLQRSPDSIPALVNQGTLYNLMGDFTNALPPLTRALSLTNVYAARLTRAMVYLRAGQLDAAEADCSELMRTFPAAYNACVLLGDIALQQRQTNAAIGYYKQFLANARAETPEARWIAARVSSLTH